MRTIIIIKIMGSICGGTSSIADECLNFANSSILYRVTQKKVGKS